MKNENMRWMCVCVCLCRNKVHNVRQHVEITVRLTHFRVARFILHWSPPPPHMRTTWNSLRTINRRHNAVSLHHVCIHKLKMFIVFACLNSKSNDSLPHSGKGGRSGSGNGVYRMIRIVEDDDDKQGICLFHHFISVWKLQRPQMK